MMNLEVKPEDNKPTCRVCVSKEEAAKMKVGSKVNLALSGEVKSLHPDLDDKELYEVEIENPSVEVEGENEPEESESMATMPLKKLKSKIQKDSEDKE